MKKSVFAMLLAIAIMAILGRGINNAMIAIGIVYIPIFARIARGEVLSVKGAGHVACCFYGRADGQADESRLSEHRRHLRSHGRRQHFDAPAIRGGIEVRGERLSFLNYFHQRVG